MKFANFLRTPYFKEHPVAAFAFSETNKNEKIYSYTFFYIRKPIFFPEPQFS